MKKFKKKEALTLGLTAGSLGLSAANLGVNYKRGKENTELQERQLKTLVTELLAAMPLKQSMILRPGR